MNPHNFSRLSKRGAKLALLLCVVLAVCATALVFTARSRAQEREIEDKIPAHLPVKFKIRNPEKAKDLNNDDWLRDIEIEMKNTGTKPIYFVRFGLYFIDVEFSPGRQYGIPLAYGRHKMMEIDERARPEDVPLMPGETYVFRISASSVRGWNHHKTRENKPHPKKIGLRFYELNFGDGTGFLGTGGDPIPGKKSSVDEKGKKTAAADGRRSRPPDSPLQRAYLLPAEFLPVNFYPAAGGSAPGATAPQTCCPGTPCQKMRTVFGGNCFCDNDAPPSHVESVFDCNSSAVCGEVGEDEQVCGEGTEDFHTCTNFFVASCGSTPPPPPPTQTPPPTETPTPAPTPIDLCTEGCKPNPSCECIPHADPGGPTVLSYECTSCGLGAPAGSQPANYCDPTFTNGCPPGTFNNGNDCCVCDPCPTPTPCPDPPPTYPCGAVIPDDLDACPHNNEPCDPISPVLVDVEGDGFALTDGAGGVRFDLDSNGAREQLSWTAAGADDAWLALDRDGDGTIGNGGELFGNFTPQPAPPAGEQRNGFLALAVFDRAANGGNGDRLIDARDSVFARLRLWRDADHDGVSGPSELFTLPALDVVRLHLDYKESKRVDGHGNRFRYRAKLDDARGAKAGRWAWDVFLTRAP